MIQGCNVPPPLLTSQAASEEGFLLLLLLPRPGDTCDMMSLCVGRGFEF